MAKKISSWKTKGMNKDLSVSAFNSEFAFENRNLRLSTNDSNTTLSWVNERGPSEVTLKTGNETVTLEGTPIGTAILNHYLIIFTTTSSEQNYPDHIYRISAGAGEGLFELYTLYEGNLGFSTDYPIETLTSFESEDVQKVYWTDGYNQPRLINISPNIDSSRTVRGRNNQFDFVPTLQLNETFTIKKVLGGGGEFAPGVIQYAFTYYNKNGQESNIIYTSPLYYLSYADRGASPEDKVDNVFNITISSIDLNFDYLRIYSIQRTSINGTPIVKRLQDISTKNAVYNTGTSVSSLYYTDTGTNGDTVDPTELLYKGGYNITAGTMEQKDNTLFLGNIVNKKPVISSSTRSIIKNNISVSCTSRTIYPQKVSDAPYLYYNQLTSLDSSSKTTPCSTFKKGNTYRLGVQFQDYQGNWSEPIYINDVSMTGSPSGNGASITLPRYTMTLGWNAVSALTSSYKKVRGVFVYPEMQDRNIICQGVGASTLYTDNNRGTNGADAPTGFLYAQSSWFFRPFEESNTLTSTTNSPKGFGYLYYINANGSPENAKGVEIQGAFHDDDKFQVDKECLTIHSPEVEFNDQLYNIDFNNPIIKKVGKSVFGYTLSDISIQTETPTISSTGAGFIHKSFKKTDASGIIAGLFYEDYLVDDNEELETYSQESTPIKYLIYPWQGSGSLNNDIIRPNNKGVQSAVLKKKVISNLRYAETTYETSSSLSVSNIPQLFSSNEVSVVKIGGSGVYQGNIDTMITPNYMDGIYMAGIEKSLNGVSWEDPAFSANVLAKTHSWTESSEATRGIKCWYNNSWVSVDTAIGNDYNDLMMKKLPVRMKYKSTPHLVVTTSNNITISNGLPILEVGKTPTNIYGGSNTDALKANNWVPCGEPVRIDNISENNSAVFYCDWGDTYYQRYDCLKTYPFTTEDTNQIIEIGSFMLESYVNIDGRYDRNRGQVSNLNMSPTNFNLINHVYSQPNNFFTYKITEYYNSSSEETHNYPNQITWSKTKEDGADVDLWTNVTLASTMALDGNKGKINKIVRMNDQLLAFQDTGISQILYNENTQITTTQGVPIEIANSGKVQGKRYVSDTIGCSNKWSMASSPIGIYFIDSIGKNIFLFNGQLNNLSASLGFNTWAKKNIPDANILWHPTMDTDAFVSYYDKINQEVLFINREDCLAYSEKVGAFTSFYSYEEAPYFCNLDGTGIWINKWWTIPSGSTTPTINPNYSLGLHHQGDYGNFFGLTKPYSTILIANPEPQTDKIFTNLEFRACVAGEGDITSVTENNVTTETFDPYLPFDYIEAWNEYQHGVATLSTKNGRGGMQHHLSDNTAALKRKFRMWRCDIPRNNLGIDSNVNVFDYTFDDTFHTTTTNNAKPNDRMRNPWLYIRMSKEAENTHKTEIHDLVITYFN